MPAPSTMASVRAMAVFAPPGVPGRAAETHQGLEQPPPPPAPAPPPAPGPPPGASRHRAPRIVMVVDHDGRA